MKTELPALEIRRLVERAVGPVSQFDALPEGLASQTFGFRQGAAHYVARVGRISAGYRKDAFAWRSFSSASLPIPEIVSIETFGAIAVCISRRAPGERLCDVDADLSARVDDVLAELSRTNTSATAGFGVFDELGEAPCASWREFLLQASDPTFCDWTLAPGRSDREHIEAAARAIERLAPADPPPRGLIHGDFGAANLLTDGRDITAVIDWDRALIGDVLYDQANLFFWREPRLRNLVALLAARRNGDADWRRRMLCYQLRICLQELSESLTGLQPVDLRWLFARCAELLADAERLG